jgi:hypothetical protein
MDHPALRVEGLQGGQMRARADHPVGSLYEAEHAPHLILSRRSRAKVISGVGNIYSLRAGGTGHAGPRVSCVFNRSTSPVGHHDATRRNKQLRNAVEEEWCCPRSLES